MFRKRRKTMAGEMNMSRGTKMSNEMGMSRQTMGGSPEEGGEGPPSAATDMDLLRRVAAELGDELLGPPGALPD
jgi:hypothetical protein